MPGWHDLQTALRDTLLGGDADAAAREVAGDGIAPEARLSIYRHHVLTTLTAALKTTYPVICRLVDERFFGYAADRYIRARPPSGPCLFEYGASFSDFLAEFDPCRHLPYLPDVARLEWAMNVAWHAADVTPLEPPRLASVAAADLPRLTVTLESSVSYLASPWPIDQIWRANQDDASSTVDLTAGAAQLEIRRHDGVVGMRSLAPGTYALRSALARSLTLEQAVSAAFEADPSFDLTSALRELIEHRIVVDFTVSK
jgi:hypothetical protein